MLALEKTRGGAIRVALEGGGELEADTVLYATGRAPNTAGLGLEALGVALAPNGAVVVDEAYRSNVPGIYAIGDVIDRVQLTPVALAEAMALVDGLFGQGGAPGRLHAHPDRGLHPSEHRHDRLLGGGGARAGSSGSPSTAPTSSRCATRFRAAASAP